MEFHDEFSAEERVRLNEEFDRLKDTHYLDHAGATLYAASYVKGVADQLAGSFFCNPHTSKTTADLIDQVRFKILNFFNTDSSKYSVVFTSGATASLKAVAECFNFTADGHFVHLADNHTSVLGMRAVVGTSNIHSLSRDQFLRSKSPTTIGGEANSLVVFPAQCNFNGYKHDLEAIDRIQRSGIEVVDGGSNWYVCLDAASYVSTSHLDLKIYSPDFVAISFYKIFGYPSGLGALLVSERGAGVLNKRYYGGGTVKIAMARQNWHQPRDCLHERFEDGTLPFLSIIALLRGFETFDKLVPPRLPGETSMERISRHTFQLAKYFHGQLKGLTHENGRAVARIYNDTEFETGARQGGIVNFNVLHDDGRYVGFAEIACMAAIHKIHLRTGCFCNPGACQRVLGLSDDEVKHHFEAGHICGDAYDLIDGQPTGSVRVSVGYMTQKSNLDAVIDMLEKCYVRKRLVALDRRRILADYKVDRPADRKIWLREICIYPIKSAGAYKVTTKWPVTSKGLQLDREFVIVTANGVALTQKNEPRLCMLRPEIDLRRQIMRLSFPDAESTIEISYAEDRTAIKTASLCQTKVCGDRIEGLDYGDEVSEWLSEALGTSGLRLLRQNDAVKRTVRNGVAKEISLANQAQFLLVNKTSVRWLADKVEDWEDLQYSEAAGLEGVVDRFRANLVIEAGGSLVENEWTKLKIGEVAFKVDGPCTRCQMICIDQATGEKTVEPLRTIAREFQGKMRFGVYLSQAATSPESRFLNCGEITVQ